MEILDASRFEDKDGNRRPYVPLPELLQRFEPGSTIDLDSPQRATEEIQSLIFDARKIANGFMLGKGKEVRFDPLQLNWGDLVDTLGYDAAKDEMRRRQQEESERPLRVDPKARIAGKGHESSDAGGITLELSEDGFHGVPLGTDRRNSHNLDIHRYVYLGTSVNIVGRNDVPYTQYVHDMGNVPTFERLWDGEFMFSGRNPVATFEGRDFFEKLVTDPDFSHDNDPFYKTACMLKDLVARELTE